MEVGARLGNRRGILVLVAGIFLAFGCARPADSPDDLLKDLEALGAEWREIDASAETAATSGDLERICRQVNRWLGRFDRTDRAILDHLQSLGDPPAEALDRQRNAGQQMRSAVDAVRRQACEA